MRKMWKKTAAATMMATALISMTGCTVSIRFERSARRTLPEKLSSADEKTWAEPVAVNKSGVAEILQKETTAKMIEESEQKTEAMEISATILEEASSSVQSTTTDSFVIPMPP